MSRQIQKTPPKCIPHLMQRETPGNRYFPNQILSVLNKRLPQGLHWGLVLLIRHSMGALGKGDKRGRIKVYCPRIVQVSQHLCLRLQVQSRNHSMFIHSQEVSSTTRSYHLWKQTEKQRRRKKIRIGKMKLENLTLARSGNLRVLNSMLTYWRNIEFQKVTNLSVLMPVQCWMK